MSAIQDYYEKMRNDIVEMERKDMLYRQLQLLERIDRNTSFADNLGANLLGNFIFDGGVFLISKLFKRL